MVATRLICLSLAMTGTSAAQELPIQFHALPSLAMREDSPVIRQPVATGEPFTVAGPRGVLVGQQQGEFEAWLLPVKLLSHMTIEVNVQGYPVPIALNSMAREIEVRPERTTITYAHIALTVRQIMFSSRSGGPVVLFQIDSLHPVELVFRFTPELRKMWPELSSGATSTEWVEPGGYYVLHSDFNDFAGAVALPGARPGVMAPYQERPQVHPLEFHLHVEPSDAGKFFPLLMATGTTSSTADARALGLTMARENDSLAAVFATHQQEYHDAAATRTHLVTPDDNLNKAFDWAATSIEQLRTFASTGEEALVAGYYASGDSARPGFGWFFGRDALYTLPAVEGFGDFALARSELEFLIKRQRADGKIMHEYSQTAAETAWDKLPYEYAAADATPLFLTAMLDYVRASGDLDFLRSHREAVTRAWTFETTHDGNGDGVYDNSQGTGWVEDWKPAAPQQEIYIALLDEQASRAVSELAALLHDPATADTARVRADRVHATIEREYYIADRDTYAFSLDAGVLDRTATLYPALAWWGEGSGLTHANDMLKRWASHDFATDWGVRDVAASDPKFDGMSYHRGAVWPLFTGWAAMAQYASGHPLAGYQAAMQNVDLTWAQDPGAVTELLSGDFFEPFGRSTSHQLWSSAMVITPLLRGMLGLHVDAVRHSISVHPQLPGNWESARLEKLHVGESTVTLEFRREGVYLTTRLTTLSGAAVSLTGADRDGMLRQSTPAVEVSFPHALPLRGSRTAQMKVLREEHSANSLTLQLEGVADTQATMHLNNRSGATVRAEGVKLDGDTVTVRFETGAGYVPQTVVLRW